MWGMTFPLARIRRHDIADRRGRPARRAVTTVGTLFAVGARGLAVGFGIALLGLAGSGTASLAILGVLALGSALLSWSE